GEQRSGEDHGKSEQRFSKYFRCALVHDGNVRGARFGERPGERGRRGSSAVARGAGWRTDRIDSVVRSAARAVGTFGICRGDRGPGTGRCVPALYRRNLWIGARRESVALGQASVGIASANGRKRASVARSRPRHDRNSEQWKRTAGRHSRDRSPAFTMSLEKFSRNLL